MPMPKSQQSWVQSQHSATQWNPRAADEYPKKSPCYEVGKSAGTVVISAHVGSEGGG